MKSFNLKLFALCLFVALFVIPHVWASVPVGTGFPYEVKDIDPNVMEPNCYDIRFRLYDDPNFLIAEQVGEVIEINDVNLVDGSFSTVLDFGSDPNIFNGDARWLEIALLPVDTNLTWDEANTLEPREIFAVPYALYAMNPSVNGLKWEGDTILIEDPNGKWINLKGDKGDIPAHKWNGYSLSFENPDGTFGSSRYLKGSRGDAGEQGPQGPAGPTLGIYDSLGLASSGGRAAGDAGGRSISNLGDVEAETYHGDGSQLTGIGGSIPAGVIVIWSGSSSNIPSGWSLCDGTNGTPDLRNSFVLGAGDVYGVGDTGGEKEHTLTVNEMPAHGHTQRYSAHPSGDNVGPFMTSARGNVYHGAESSDSTALMGGGQPHNNMPPYFALAYIMKN